MSVSFVGSNSDSSANPTSGAWSLSGLSWEPDDVGIFWWYSSREAKTITEPATVTQKYDTTIALGDLGRLFIGYRRLQSGDSSFSWSSSSVAGSGVSFGVDVFRRAGGSGDPFSDVSGNPSGYTNAQAPTMPSVVPTYDNELIYTIVGFLGASFDGVTPPDGYSIASEEFITSPIVGVATAYKLVSGGAGDTQSPGGFNTGTSSANDGIRWTGAIAPISLSLSIDSGSYSLTGSDISFETGRLMETSGGGGDHPPVRPHFKGVQQYHHQRIEEAKRTLTSDEELALLLISILSYDDDVL